MHEVAAIVLAAGFARRFGSQKLKYAVEINGCIKPLILHALLPWLAVFKQVTVVINADSHALQALVNRELNAEQAAKINWQICESAEDGMAASLVCGIKAHADASGWLIGLADMPKVSVQVISQVRDVISNRARNEKTLAAPYYHDLRGHPAGFSAHYFDELTSLTGDAGAKHIMQREANFITKIISADDGVLLDIDLLSDIK